MAFAASMLDARAVMNFVIDPTHRGISTCAVAVVSVIILLSTADTTKNPSKLNTSSVSRVESSI